MKRLLRFLWTGVWAMPKPCEHKYEVYETAERLESNLFSSGKRRIVGKIYVLKCSNCGDMKTEEANL